MATYKQASFKNSRIAARSPTLARTHDVTSIPNDAANHLVLGADTTRTSIYCRNAETTPGLDLRFGYSDDVNLDTEGILLRANEGMNNDTPGEVYFRNVGGAGAISLIVDEGTG